MRVQINKLRYDYIQNTAHKITALQDVSFCIEDGDFLGIAGAAGCGKTTLLQLLAGLYEPKEGQILLDGEDINAAGYDKHMLRRLVGIVFQYPEYQLFETTVEKDVAFALKHDRLHNKEKAERVRWALETMGFDYEAIRGQPPLALSGGEKRRVAIAGVLVQRPKLLMFDEPIAGLDPYAVERFLALMKRLNEAGTAIVIVSHNMEALCEYTRHMLVLSGGRVSDYGSTREVFTRLNRSSLQSSAENRLSCDVSFAQTYAGRITALLAQRGMRLENAPVTYKELLLALKRQLGGNG